MNKLKHFGLGRLLSSLALDEFHGPRNGLSFDDG